MEILQRILLYIWTSLRISGVKLPLFGFLFHKPKKKFEDTIIYTVHGDVNFDIREQELIHEAAKDMYRFTNGAILFEVKFDLAPDDEIIDKNVILKVESDYEHIQKRDAKEADGKTIGLCYTRDNETRSIHMVCDRLKKSDNLFRSTVIHELGHFIDMDHTTGNSIMHPQNSNLVPYPTYIDAVELAKLWGCSPDDFAYFKL